MSSSKERILQARADWAAGRMKLPDLDDQEFIPLPPDADLIAAVLSAVAPGLPAVPIAVAVVAGSALVAVLDIRVNAWVTGAFLLTEVLALVVVLGVARYALSPSGFEAPFG